MKYFFCPRLMVLAGSLLGCAPLAWPTVGACTSGTTLDNYQPSSLQSGCAYVDNSFTNIGVNSQEQSVLGTPGAITLTSNPALGDTLDSTSGLGVAEFTSPAWTESNGGQGGTDVEYVVQANTGGTVGGYTFTNGVNGYVSPAAEPWAISSLTLDTSMFSTTGPNGGGAGTNLVVQELFCLSNTTDAPVNGSCPTADSGEIYLELQSNAAGGFYVNVIDCTGPGNVAAFGCDQDGFSTDPTDRIITYAIPGNGVQAISVLDDLYLVTQASTSITINELINSFGDESPVPEPSSFLLVGFAAAGFGLLRLKKESEFIPPTGSKPTRDFR